MEIYKDKNAPVEDRVADLLSKMTLQEKIGQLHQQPFDINKVDELSKLAAEGKIGSLILSGTAFAGTEKPISITAPATNKVQKAAVENSRLSIPIINGRDIIHGSKTTFPISVSQAGTWDYDLIKQGAEIMAKEASYDSVHWTFAPMIDISRDPRWGRIMESPGEDPCLGAMYATAMVEGIQGEDMSKPGKLAACAKHYIGYGGAEGGRDYSKAEISDYTLRNIYLTSFKAAVKAGVSTVMNSFNEVSGTPIAASKYHLRDILKGELGFDGYVISDWGSVEQLENIGVAKDRKECAELAINAGVDMDMCDWVYDENLEALVNEGKVSMETIDDAVSRILRIKFLKGLFENPYTEERSYEEVTLLPEYFEFAEKFAENSLVLLKNEGNILPLKKDSTVCLTGPLAKNRESLLGNWMASGEPSSSMSLYESLVNKIGKDNVLVQPNSDTVALYGQEKVSDVVIFATGEYRDVSGEARSISRLELDDSRLELIKRAKLNGSKVVTVIFAGRPLAIEEVAMYSDAIIYAWLPGCRGANAISNVLFGDFNPCAKLPVTMPRATGQIPIYYNTPRNPRFVDEYYPDGHGFNIGKRCIVNYEDMSGAPLYPFGYGLSYTEFKYSDISVNTKSMTLSELKNGKKFEVSARIENVGGREGAEIVQCYITDVKSKMTRPLKELKAFEKIKIARGEDIKITFKLGFDELAYYGPDKSFDVEPGEFVFNIARNSQDNALTVSVNVTD